MHRRSTGSLVLVSLLFAGCIVPENERPSVGFGTVLATRFVHRGMTLVDRPVLQPKLGIGMNTVHGDRLGVEVEASMDLSNDTGAAWFPDGHAGRFTQIELLASWQRQIGDVSVTAGIHNYILPNGIEFISGSPAGSERGSTSEVFARVTASVLEANPYVSVHYDYDEVDGLYLRAGIAEDIPLGNLLENLSLGLDGSLGYVSKEQGDWMYDIKEDGFADLRGEIVLKWQCDTRTQVRAGAHGSLIVDNDIDDWFRDIGIDDDPIWFTIGVAWTL
jgi:hypothetical protein